VEAAGYLCFLDDAIQLMKRLNNIKEQSKSDTRFCIAFPLSNWYNVYLYPLRWSPR
jgi:hypothetical protein